MALRRAEEFAFGRWLQPASRALVGDRSRAYLSELSAAEWLEPQRLEALCLERLRALLIHAAARVPYYRELFREHDFDPRGLRATAELERLPPLDRRTLRLEATRLRAEGASDLIEDATGGSTGEPVVFFHDRRFRQRAAAAAWRARGWAGWTPGQRTAWIWGAPRETRGAQALAGRARSWIERRVVLDAFDASTAAMRDWTRRLQRFRPRWLYGYASALDRYAEHVLGVGPRIDGVRGVVSTAERLLGGQRTRIGQAFGCPVYDHYGSREFPLLAAECAAGCMHVASDLYHLEVLDDRGTGGRLLVTALDNHGMPFVRYDIGDRAALVPGRCPCGRGLGLLRLTGGRTSDHFVVAGGRVVHGEYFTHLLYGVPGIARFQFHQTAPDRIVLRVVRERGFGPRAEAGLAAARRTIEREIDPRLTLEIDWVEHIAPTPGGKQRFTVSDLAADGRSEETRR